MAYKVLTSLIGVLRHDFTTFGYLLFTNQYFAISEAVLDSFGFNSFPNCQKSSPNIYGFCPQRGMGYGLLRLYGLWSVFLCKPTWWTENPMGLKGVWGNWAMGYEGVDCRQIFLCKPACSGSNVRFWRPGNCHWYQKELCQKERDIGGPGGQVSMSRTTSDKLETCPQRTKVHHQQNVQLYFDNFHSKCGNFG